MTEIFYRLVSEANGELYQFKKEERLAFTREVTAALLESENDPNLLEILKEVRNILNTYSKMNLLLPPSKKIEQERRELADNCLQIRAKIFERNKKCLKGIRYKSLSNEAFSALKKTDVTAYFFIAIYLLECRGRLLEFLLRHSSS